MKVKDNFHHPEKWGEGWYLNKTDLIPFKLIDEVFIEQPPINAPKDWKPRIYTQGEDE